MRLSKRDNGNGYVMWLSARDTYAWANTPGTMWPCSKVAGHRLVVAVDRNGLYELTFDEHRENVGLDGNELDAIVADHLPKGLRHLWPTWEQAEAA